jgi:Icc-related predicted phosphoesterase
VKELRVIFATDFHGSEVCFRKLFNLAARAHADVIVAGGDVCGKAMVPIVARNGQFEGKLLGQPFRVSGGDDLAEVERNIRFNGMYPLQCTPQELADMTTDDELRDRIMRREMVNAVERWVEIAEEKLEYSDAVCVSLPGNDDDLAIDDALNRSTRIRNCDAQVLDFEHVQILGLGASNVTPWHSPREFSEEELESRLAQMAAEIDAERPLIANIHVPPFQSTLDDAPLVDDDLRPIIRGGSPVVGPVGSTAVRAFLEGLQPCLSLHGHVHECRGSTWIGQTQAVNPGSDYSSGTLQAALVTLDLRKGKTKRCQFVSG